MKKKIFSLFLLLPIFLIGCSKSIPLEFREYNTFIKEFDPKKDVENDLYYQKSKTEKITYKDFYNNEVTISSYRDLYRQTNDNRVYLNAPSLENRKMLVIPIYFDDSDISTLEKDRIIIQNAFFGKEEMTTGESVASYYNKASYGQLKLTGKVSDWYHFNMTGKQLASLVSGKNIEAVTRLVVGSAIEWYNSNYDDSFSFDTDNDSYIDSLYVIYKYPKGNKGSLFWAITEHMVANERINFISHGLSYQVNKIEPYANSYSWTSYDFINENNNVADSHILLHETGHLFGLTDYYSDVTFQPTGFMDMMDYNIGDHTGFSKMLLSWTTPKIIKNPGKIELNTFSDTGDLLLVPYSKYNDTPYDEYLLLEYYAPTNLNEKDSNLTFLYQDNFNNTKEGHLFNTYGIKLYHVDARLAYLTNKGNKGSVITIMGDEDEAKKLEEYKKTHSTRYLVDFANSNSLFNGRVLYNLIEKDNANNLINGMPANENSLFKINDSFGYEKYSSFKFNNGEKPKFKFKIESLDPKKAIIIFERF